MGVGGGCERGATNPTPCSRAEQVGTEQNKLCQLMGVGGSWLGGKVALVLLALFLLPRQRGRIKGHGVKLARHWVKEASRRPRIRR